MLFIKALCIVFLGLQVVIPWMKADELPNAEKEVLSRVRSTTGEDQAESLEFLALIREDLGKLKEAIDTWGYLGTHHGGLTARNDTSAPDTTYGQRARFHMQRLRRIRNLLAHPPALPSRELADRLTRAQDEIRYPTGNAGFVHLRMPLDMDGDLIPEVFTVVGERNDLKSAATMLLLVHKWDGKRYVQGFKWSSSLWSLDPGESGTRRLEPDFIVTDGGHGMYVVRVSFERDTDNGSTIRSNGSEIGWYP